MRESEVKAREIIIKMQFQKHPISFEQAKHCALVSIDLKIEILKELMSRGLDVHQSISTPKKLFADVFNPKLIFLEQIREALLNI